MDAALEFLCCPHCGAGLALAGATVRCPAGHAFDVARQGYVSLLAGPRAAPGDAAGWWPRAPRSSPRATTRRSRTRSPPPRPSALARRPARLRRSSLGAGTGHHLAAVLDRVPGRLGLALDASAAALRRAARAHPRMAAVGCDAWRALPVRSGRSRSP